MVPPVETLGTDMFREQHQIIDRELTEIETELSRVTAETQPWQKAVPAFRRLLILLEADVEHHADEEERLIYGPLARRPGGLTPTLAACYGEHRTLRMEAEALHHDMALAFSGHPPDEAALYRRCAGLIGLLRMHMAREDEVLFLAAEQELTHQDLLRMTSPAPVTPAHRSA